MKTQLRRNLILIVLVGLVTFIAQAEPLEILVEDANAPWSYADGTGYVNEAIKEAFLAVKIPVTLKVVPYSRCKFLVMEGKTVACASMSRLIELEGLVQFPDQPFYITQFIYFQRKKQPAVVQSENELGQGMTVGVVNGYEYPGSAYQAQQRGATFENGRSDEVNLQKLAQGRINLALVSTNNMEPPEIKVSQAGVQNEVIYAFSSGSLNTYIGFSVHHEKGLWALGKFNEGFKLISTNGTLKRLKSQWFGGSVTH